MMPCDSHAIAVECQGGCVVADGEGISADDGGGRKEMRGRAGGGGELGAGLS